MKRAYVLGLTLVAGFASVFVCLTLLGSTPVAAGAAAELPGDDAGAAVVAAVPQYGGAVEGVAPRFARPNAPDAFAQIDVYYADDWVAGSVDMEPLAAVVVTVTDSAMQVKDSATVTADGAGSFFVPCAEWFSGWCPDIKPGDHVTVTTDAGAVAVVSPVGEILARLDAAANTAAGIVNAPWFDVDLDAGCFDWNNPATYVEVSVDPDGGDFLCDFDLAGWDLEPGDTVAIFYVEPDGDRVFNRFGFPWMRVNSGHDGVGGDYAAGHTLWITVTDELGAIKATAQTQSAYHAGWNGDGFETQSWQWSPAQPDIVAGDLVTFTADDGYANLLQVGSIAGNLDVGADLISGTLSVPALTGTLPVECHPWGAWDDGLWDVQVKYSAAAADGSAAYTCDWSAEWDIVPGKDVGVMYIEPDLDRVIDVFRDPAPYLRIEKNAQGAAGEGGNMLFTINYRNDGTAAATNVLITDTMIGMTYLLDTSPFAVTTGTIPGGEYAALDLGVVGAGDHGQISFYADVTAAAFEIITNTVEIASDNPFDQGEPWEKVSVWVGDVRENDTHLNVGKGAWTDDPAPDTEVIFSVNVCNPGGTSSSGTTMEDVLHPAFTLVDWWAQQPGWMEMTRSAHSLELFTYAIPSGECSDVYLRTSVDADMEPGATVTNTATIASASDLEIEDNGSFWEGQINGPRVNLTIQKSWNGGTLVPGGELRYNVNYENNGNQPVGPFRITDTLPVSTTFAGAWMYDETGPQPFAPALLGDGFVVWEIPGLPNGFSNSFDVALNVETSAAPGLFLVNEVTIAPQPGEERLTDNVAAWTETLYEAGPNLRVFKWHTWNGDGQLGYNLAFENTGNVATGEFWLTDTLPLDTALGDWWGPDFPDDRLLQTVATAEQIAWHFGDIYPGEGGRVACNADLAYPGEPVRWYTNTVEASIPPGDANAADNYYEDVAFSGGEVWRAEIYVDPGHSSMWGGAIPGSEVTVAAPAGPFYAAADPTGEWVIDDIGPVAPGDTITVTAGAGLLPVVMSVPDPFAADADSQTRTVWGQIDHLDRKEVGVSLDGGPSRVVQTDQNGQYSAVFDTFPRGGSGVVRYATRTSDADVIYHRGFQSPDLIMNVNYGHDWVEGQYEPGHTIWLTATESDQTTVKATAVLTTGAVPWWEGETGFSTNWQGWLPEQPDLMPGDWVFGLVDNGFTSTVHIGIIDGVLSMENDTVAGTISAPWFEDALNGNCAVWEEFGPTFDFVVNPQEGDYFCDFGAAGWDLQPGQQVGVQYQEVDQDWVINMFEEPAPDLQIAKHALGNSVPGEGGVIPLVIEVWNNGGAAAESVVVSDTMTGLSYVTDTLGLAHSGSGAGPITWELGLVEPGAYIRFNVYAEVLAGAGAIVTNTAVIATSNPYEQGDPSELVSTWTEVVTAEATAVSIDKWAWTGDPAPDTTFVFALNPCNNTQVAAAHVLVTDTLHPSLTLQLWWSDYPGWVEVASSPDRLTVGTSAMAAYTCEAIYVAVALSPDATPGMPITNTALLAATNDGDTSDNTATWEGAVGAPHVNLAVDQWWNGGTLVPGGEIRYNLQAQNNGNLPLSGPILLTDTLPPGTSYVASWRYDHQDQAEAATPILVTDDKVVWDLGDLANGIVDEIELVLAINPEMAPGSILTNTLTVSPQPGEDGYEDNFAVWVEAVHEPGPNLRVRKEGAWQDWGEDRPVAQYWTMVENIGDVWLGPVTLVDVYAPEMVFHDGPDTAWSRLEEWVDDPSSHTVTATFSHLAPGETTWFNFATIVPASAPMPEGIVFTNTATVAPAAGEIDGGDNSAQAVLISGPDLVVEKEWIGGEALPGELITFSLAFANERPENQWWWNLDGTAWLTDTLDEDLMLAGAQLRHCDEFGNPCAFAPTAVDGTRLIWELWPLAAGERNEIWLTARISDTAEGDDVLGNYAVIGSSQPADDAEPNYANNRDGVAVPIALPKFVVDKGYESNRIAGMPVTYTVTAKNAGHISATGVLFSDPLPDDLTYGTGDGTFDGATVDWLFPVVAPGETVEGWFSAVLPCAAGGTIVNEEYGVSASDQGVTSTFGPAVSLTVAAPTIDVALAHAAEPVPVGTTLAFTGTAGSNGTALAYAWDFGDGESASGLQATHAYVTDGDFTVTFTATDACGFSANASAVVTIEAPDLVAAFAQSATTIKAGEPVTFTDLSTTNGPAIVAWAWDFGDGAPLVTTQHAVHVFEDAGTFTVTLTVTDALGYTDTASGVVIVEEGMATVLLPLIKGP